MVGLTVGATVVGEPSAPVVVVAVTMATEPETVPVGNAVVEFALKTLVVATFWMVMYLVIVMVEVVVEVSATANKGRSAAVRKADICILMRV